MDYHLFNIGGKGTDPQWRWMREEGVITAGFENELGDKGETILRGLPEGDLVVAYANRRGYVGIGRIQPEDTYRLIPEAELPAWKGARHRHYRSVEWLLVVPSLSNAVPISAADKRFPRHTWETLDAALGERIEELLRPANAAAVDEVLKTTTVAITAAAGSPSDASLPAAGRLPAGQLRKITSDFIWQAVQELLQDATVEGFGESTDYDLLADGVRLAPKQVFGLAGTAALGFQLKPSHFTAGKGSLCFALLQAAGFQIVPKGEELPALDLPIEPEEEEWAEGYIKLVQHLKKERSAGLSQAKKEAFRKQHGRLFCEECLLDPVQVWGLAGEACIEVHHDEVHVADMAPGHKTSLDKLRCLCANCHRVLHSQLRA